MEKLVVSKPNLETPVTRPFIAAWQVESESLPIETHSQEIENAKPDTDPTKMEVKVHTKKRLVVVR